MCVFCGIDPYTPSQPLSVPRNASVDAPTSFNAMKMARSPAPDLPPLPALSAAGTPICTSCWPCRAGRSFVLRAPGEGSGVRGQGSGVRGQGSGVRGQGEGGGERATLRPRCSVCSTAHTMAGARRGPNSSFAMTSSFLRNQSSSRYMQRVPLDLSTTAGLQEGGAAQSARSLECRWLGRGQQTMTEGRGGEGERPRS